jgi:plastocyanin
VIFGNGYALHTQYLGSIVSTQNSTSGKPFEPPEVSGIVGFAGRFASRIGADPLIATLVAQMGPAACPFVFSLCGNLKAPGVLTVCGAGGHHSGALQYTPMVSFSTTGFYAIWTVDMAVDGQRLGVNSALYNLLSPSISGTLVDSGASGLLLGDAAFEALQQTFLGNCSASNLHGVCDVAQNASLFAGRCFSMSDAQRAQFPTLTIVAGRDAPISIDIAPSSYLVQGLCSNASLYALAIHNSGDNSTILGDPLMLSNLVVYDVQNQRMGFAPTSFCEWQNALCISATADATSSATSPVTGLFSVSLSTPATVTTVVAYTIDGAASTAREGTDFASLSGIVTFSPQDTMQTIEVKPLVAEGSSGTTTLTLMLSSPSQGSGLVIGDSPCSASTITIFGSGDTNAPSTSSVAAASTIAATTTRVPSSTSAATSTPAPDSTNTAAPTTAEVFTSTASTSSAAETTTAEATQPSVTALIDVIVGPPDAPLTFRDGATNSSVVLALLGAVVRFVWASAGHSVVSGSNCTASGVFGSGGAFNVGHEYLLAIAPPQFAAGATYDFYCQPHCSFGMAGSIVVAGPALSSSTSSSEQLSTAAQVTSTTATTTSTVLASSSSCSRFST